MASRLGLRVPVLRALAADSSSGSVLLRASASTLAASNAADPASKDPKPATTANLLWLEGKLSALSSSHSARLGQLHRETCSMAVELDKALADHAANISQAKLQVWELSATVALAGGCFILVGLYMFQ